MHYVYLLRSFKDEQFYIGSASDLKKRFYQHNQGHNWPRFS
ncbi:GIY-YIG nuclease family protein [Candidatus Parcubacteria bacterium]|nr:GIY-YIG nuclease family protein [Candidatus Parcubacteria bacterium]